MANEITISGTIISEGDYEDLITAAEAIVDPTLSDITPPDARLSQLISVASIQVQRYIGYFYDAGEDVPADLKFAVQQYVAFLWSQDSTASSGDFESESLGQYSYNRGRGLGVVNQRMDRILGLLAPFRVKSSPVIVSGTTEIEHGETELE